MASHVDPRITRTKLAFEQAIVELAAQRPISRITVAELAERAGTTRATFYNRYSNPLELLIKVLSTDLDRGHDREEQLRAQGGHSSEELLRLATSGVADHVERFRPVYQRALGDPADRGVYDALVRHFSDYGMAFIGRGAHLPATRHELLAAFVANGFAGAIKAWLADPSVTKDDLIDAAIACVPSWWR